MYMCFECISASVVVSSDDFGLCFLSAHADEVSSDRRHAVLHWHGTISPWT